MPPHANDTSRYFSGQAEGGQKKRDQECYEPGGATSDLSTRLKQSLDPSPAYIEGKEVKSFGGLTFRDKPSPVAKGGKFLLVQDEKAVSLELAFRSKPSEVSTKHKPVHSSPEPQHVSAESFMFEFEPVTTAESFVSELENFDSEKEWEKQVAIVLRAAIDRMDAAATAKAAAIMEERSVMIDGVLYMKA